MSAHGTTRHPAVVQPIFPVTIDDPAWSGDDTAGSITISRLGVPLLRARDASTFATRLRGLHGSLPLGPFDALIIRPCRAIQTFRMPCTIDVVFLDRTGMVLRIATVPPGGLRLCSRAQVALEMAAGTAARLSLAPGHVLSASMGEWA